MSNSLFSVEEQAEQMNVKIKVVGVGGGGGNMINHMIKEGIEGIEMIVANTDSQALNNNLAPIKIQLGEKLTKGLGAGMKPDVGKRAAEESYETIKASLAGSDLVFIAVGLGGGTGTGASSVVARAAKDCGALTVGVCTQPFEFEGAKRAKLAKQGLSEIRNECDSIIVIPNHKLSSIVDKNAGYKESFALVDSIIAKAVGGISNIVLPTTTDGINVDFADLSTVMSHKGLALMGMGQAQGEEAALEALKNAIESPLLDELTINGAMGVIVHFQVNPNYPFVAVTDAMNLVNDSVDEDAEVMFGTSLDPSVEIDSANVTIIATGFEREALNNDMPIKENIEKLQKTFQVRKVSGDIDFDPSSDMLDVPTYLRNQID